MAMAETLDAPAVPAAVKDGPLMVAGVEYRSRLLVGTGKYRDFDETRAAIEASGAEIVTVAIRRTNIGQDAGEPWQRGWDYFDQAWGAVLAAMKRHLEQDGTTARQL